LSSKGEKYDPKLFAEFFDWQPQPFIWLQPVWDDDEKNIRFEWYLVRQDRYGNTMFMNKVGNQPYIELKIPSNPQYYRLYVEAISGDEVRMANTTLNTPLE